MSNPYTPPSLTGYNANPPSDDGTETAANIVKWSNHLTKIGDPLKTFMESVDTNVLAAFDTVFGSALRSIATDYTVIDSDTGRFLSVTGTTTITLLPAIDAGNGFPLLIINNGSDVVTVDGDDTDTINGLANIVLASGDGLLITSDGTSWLGFHSVKPIVIEGSFVPTFTGFSSDPVSPLIRWIRQGRVVHVSLDIGSGTSDSDTFSIDNVPSEIQPFYAQRGSLNMVRDSSGDSYGTIDIGNGSGWRICYESNVVGGFTSSGSKGLIPSGFQSFSYFLGEIS